MDCAHAVVASSLTNAMDMTDICVEQDADRFFFSGNFGVTKHINEDQFVQKETEILTTFSNVFSILISHLSVANSY